MKNFVKNCPEHFVKIVLKHFPENMSGNFSGKIFRKNFSWKFFRKNFSGKIFRKNFSWKFFRKNCQEIFQENCQEKIFWLKFSGKFILKILSWKIFKFAITNLHHLSLTNSLVVDLKHILLKHSFSQNTYLYYIFILYC